MLTSGAINWGSPVNRASPLNRGLVAWYLGANPATTGKQVLDLTAKTPLAFYGSPNWRTANRGGGRYALDCTSTDSGAISGTNSSFQLSWPVTASCWAYQVSAPSNNCSYFGGWYDSAGGTPFATYQIYVNTSNNVLWAINSAGIFAQTSVSSIANGVWTHFLSVQTASSLNFYKNGVSVYSDSTARSNPTYGATANLVFGQPFAFSRNANLYVDDGRIWNRALSADEVYQVYTDSLTGYQQTLNRLPRRFASATAATSVYASRSRAVNFGGIGRLSRGSQVNA